MRRGAIWQTEETACADAADEMLIGDKCSDVRTFVDDVAVDLFDLYHGVVSEFKKAQREESHEAGRQKMRRRAMCSVCGGEFVHILALRTIMSGEAAKLCDDCRGTVKAANGEKGRRTMSWRRDLRQMRTLRQKI